MILVIFSIFLILNIIGLLNRNKAWSKMFLITQLLFIGGAGTIFILNDSNKPIEAKIKKEKIENIVNKTKEKSDSLENNTKENKDGLKVKGF
ncbi:MAG: hypothetical protein ACK4K9_11495 [Bacteroidia bacterium]